MNNNDNNIKRGRGRPRKNELNVHKLTAPITQITKTTIIPPKSQKIFLKIPVSLKELHDTIGVDLPLSVKKDTISCIKDLNLDLMSTNSEYDDLQKKYEEKVNKIKQLEDLLEYYKKISGLDLQKGSINLSKINYDYIDRHTGEVKDCTSTSCWWDSEPFSTVVIFLPEKYQCGKYYVFGCFCSINCAASYNYHINDHNTTNRFSLLKKLYEDVVGSSVINPSPPREALSKYGGPLSIEEFRNNNYNIKKNYKFLIPPMMSISTFIESNISDIYTPVQYKNNNDELVLKRTKPLAERKLFN